jgi:hypothetical protein
MNPRNFPILFDVFPIPFPMSSIDFSPHRNRNDSFAEFAVQGTTRMTPTSSSQEAGTTPLLGSIRLVVFGVICHGISWDLSWGLVMISSGWMGCLDFSKIDGI